MVGYRTVTWGINFGYGRVVCDCSMDPSRTSPRALCVLADPYLMASEVRTLERAVEETDIDVPLVLVNDPVDPVVDPDDAAAAINQSVGIASLRVLADVIREDRAWTLVYAERKLAELAGWEAPSLTRIPVEDVPCLADADIRHVTPIADGAWSELPTESVELVAERSDVSVRFGFGLLRGDVLEAPEYGVLSFHPADIREYRGLGVPQAWLDGRERMGVTLQRLNDDVDGGEIIAYAETDVSHCATLWDVYEVLHEVQSDLLADGIKRLRDPTFTPSIPDHLGSYYSIDRKNRLSFAGRTVLKNVAGRIRSRAEA